MNVKFSLAAAALLPIALFVPSGLGGVGLRMSGAASGTAIAAEQQQPLAAGWFARSSGYPIELALRPTGSAVAPIALRPAVATPFIRGTQSVEDAERSLECLTAAIYYEARSEPVEGQRAVAQVVLNRVRHPSFPNSVCGVVFQGSDRSTGCQFTFTCDGSMAAWRDPEAWERSKEVARAALAGDVDTNVGLATNYHANWMMPWWASSLERIASIGSQTFYRWKGALGEALSFTQSYAGVEPADAAANANSLGNPGNSGLVRVGVGNGATVAIHRGGTMSLAANHSVSTPNVRVHRGEDATSSDEPTNERTSDMASSVAVHRGSPTGEADPI
jgi:hypothetical protein